MPYQVRNTPFILSDKLIRRAQEVYADTRMTGLEQGVTLCGGTQVLHPGGSCRGSICSVGQKDCAGTGMSEMGNLHTHPHATAEPSGGDLMFALYRALSNGFGDYMECRIGTADGNLRCDYLTDHHDTALRAVLKDAYQTLYPRYKKAWTWWEDWAKLGHEPPVDDRTSDMQKIKDRLEGSFDRDVISMDQLAKHIEVPEELAEKAAAAGMPAQDLQWYRDHMKKPRRVG